MNKKDTRAMILVVRHWIYVDGILVYEGGDRADKKWKVLHDPYTFCLRCAQDLTCREVKHIIKKQEWSAYDDPRQIDWSMVPGSL